MSYYRVLGLQREPFSTSPDPAFFFRSLSHAQALARLEISIRLRRGLALVLGDVGTGKTTLARTLLTTISPDEGFLFHMVLDPSFDSEYQFLMHLVRMFGVTTTCKSSLDAREAIEHHLFQCGVVDGKTITLVIDEGQKLSVDMLEHLRLLLNYETNEFKLLQVVIFAQMELLGRVARVRNFMDRVALKYLLNPLSEEETVEMITFRLTQAGLSSDQSLFTPDALSSIYQASRGYPRQIALVCHRALEAMVIHQRTMVDAALLGEFMQDESRWVRETAS